jgi:hypothetical protein
VIERDSGELRREIRLGSAKIRREKERHENQQTAHRGLR